MAARLKKYSVTGYGQKVVDPKGKFYLVADVLPYIKEAVRTAYNKQSMPCLHKFVIFETEVRCAECGAVYDRYVG